MTALLPLLGLALATTPGGYRLNANAPGDLIGVSSAAVLDGGGAWLVQVMPRARYTPLDALALELQVPAVLMGFEDQTHLGVGRLRLGAWGLPRNNAPRHAVGVELSVPVTGPTLRTTGWGSLPRETLNGYDFMVLHQLQLFEERPLLIRYGLGLAADSYGRNLLGLPLPTAELAVAWTLPVTGPLSVVLEGDYVSWTYAGPSLRALGRLDLPGGHVVDLGLQTPTLDWVDWPPTSLQVIAQYRWFLPKREST